MIRLKEITDNCKCVKDFITNINSLARYARKAAANDPGTVVHLSLGDLKKIQEDVKSDLSSWYVSIKEKINKLESKQDNLLKATTNFDKQAEVLQTAATEIENQMSKVANVNNNIANLPTSYRDALIGGNAKKSGEMVDSRVLIDVERKAKQILIMFKDEDALTMNTHDLMVKANDILDKFKASGHPKTVKIEAVTRFLNGDTLFQLNSKEATN